MSFHPDSGKHVLGMPGQVNTGERRGQALTVIGVEYGACLELVGAADGVSWVDAGYGVGVVPPAVGILEEFAEVVEVEAGAHSVPAWETPYWVRSTCSTYFLKPISDVLILVRKRKLEY